MEAGLRLSWEASQGQDSLQVGYTPTEWTACKEWTDSQKCAVSRDCTRTRKNRKYKHTKSVIGNLQETDGQDQVASQVNSTKQLRVYICSSETIPVSPGFVLWVPLDVGSGVRRI